MFLKNPRNVIFSLLFPAACDVEVACAGDLCRGLAEPSAALVDAGVDAYEVGTGQVYGLSAAIDGPVEVEGAEPGGVVGVVVDVAPGVGVEHVVVAQSARVDGVGGEACAGEGQRAVGYPLRPVTLGVVDVALYVARRAAVVRPGDILRVGHAAAAGGNGGVGGGVGVTVGHGVVVQGDGAMVFAAGQFVPLVVGQPVHVGVERHHDDARLAGSAALLPVLGDVRVEGVALDIEVALRGGVDERMVEAEGDVSAPGPERDERASGETVLHLLSHLLFGVALLVEGCGADKLSRCGAIVVDVGHVCAVLHLLVYHAYEEILGVAAVAVVEREGEVVLALLGAEVDERPAGAEQTVGAVGAAFRPAVALAGVSRGEKQLLQARQIVVVVDAGGYHLGIAGAGGREQCGGHDGDECGMSYHGLTRVMWAGMSPVRTLHLCLPSRE